MLLAVSVSGQVQEFDVNDFSGGLVNGISPLLMQPNQALVLENFDLTRSGTLKPRRGMSIYQGTTTTEHTFPFYRTSDKHLLTLRSQDYFTNDTANAAMNVLTQCEPCSTSVAAGFYRQSRNWDYPFNLDFADVNSRIVMAQSKSEMFLWDGGKAFPARPRASGQVNSVGLDGGGGLTNVYRHRLAFADNDTAVQWVKVTPNAHDSYNYIDTIGGTQFVWTSFAGATVADVCDSMAFYVNASANYNAYDSTTFYVIVALGVDSSFSYAVDTAQTATLLVANKKADTSNFSPPSWYTEVNRGKVFLWDIPQPNDTAVDEILIYREHGYSGSFYYLDDIALGTVEYLDTISAPDTTDTLAFAWGPRENCQDGDCDGILDPPGGMTVEWSTALDDGVVTDLGELNDSACVAVGYCIVHVDSSGRESYASAPSCALFPVDSLRDSAKIKIALSDIPLPLDSSIVTRLLLRGTVGSVEASSDPQKYRISFNSPYITALYETRVIPLALNENPLHYDFYNVDLSIFGGDSISAAQAVDSLVAYFSSPSLYWSNVATIEDSGDYCIITSILSDEIYVKSDLNWTLVEEIVAFDNSPPYIGRWVIRDTLSITATTYTDSLRYSQFVWTQWCPEGSPDEPGGFCYDDSILTFRPSSIVAHGSRVFAVGDPRNRKSLYYSEFGRPTTWPFDKFINIPIQGGWINKLLSLEDRLIMFSQNSIFQLTGFSFFQFSIDQIVAGIGCSAPMSVAEGLNKVYFAHSSGIYRMSRFGGLSDVPLSIAIKTSYDSIGTRLQRAFGAAVGEEYWFSCAIGSEFNNRTYIFSDVPKPHWKVYTFGLQHATLFDTDTTSLDFDTKRWILVRPDDTALYEWGYASDTLDGSDEFIRKYQGPFFFRDQNRERVMYVDIDGVGTVDSLMVTLYYWDEPNSVAVDSVVIQPDFSDTFRDRAKFNKTLPNCSVAIRDFGNGQYTITGYSIGYIPWDEGFR